MRARGWVVAVMMVSGLTWPTARALAEPRDPKPAAVDVTAFVDQLRVFQDAAGGTYVVLSPTSSDARAWYGTGKALYEQVIVTRSRNGAAWDLGTWAPRVAELRPGSLQQREDGTVRKSCDGKDDAMLTEVTGEKARALLARSSFFGPALVRRAHLLARDDSGVYYYIDRLSKHHGGKGYRVFVGKKGALKQRPLTDIASDSAGQVFSTRTGEIRLVTGDAGSTVQWIKGSKRTSLVMLDVDVNSPLIYRDLGLYSFLGTLCDNL